MDQSRSSFLGFQSKMPKDPKTNFVLNLHICLSRVNKELYNEQLSMYRSGDQGSLAFLQQ